MVVKPAEARGVSLVGHTDLDGRPGFKMALSETGGHLYLYLAHLWHSGWSIVDVTDPSELDIVNFIEGPDNTRTKNIQVADGLMIAGLEKPTKGWGPKDDPMDPERPYTEGAYIFDVATNPIKPTLLSHFETGSGGTHRNYYTGGDYAFMSARRPGFTGYLLVILDVSDPADPKEVTKWWWPGQSENDDEEPTNASYYHGPAYVQGDNAYLSYGDVGMIILDISDIENPELVSQTSFGPLGSGRGVHSAIPIPETELLAVNSEPIKEGSPLAKDAESEPLNYTFIVDVSDPTPSRFLDTPISREHAGVKVISSLPLPSPEPGLSYDNYYEKPGRFGPHNQHHYRGEEFRYKTNEFLFIAHFNAGLRIYDISDPLMPTEAAYYVPEDPVERVGTRPAHPVTHFDDVVVDHRGYIYCTDSNNGLFVFESELL